MGGKQLPTRDSLETAVRAWGGDTGYWVDRRRRAEEELSKFTRSRQIMPEAGVIVEGSEPWERHAMSSEYPPVKQRGELYTPGRMPQNVLAKKMREFVPPAGFEYLVTALQKDRVALVYEDSATTRLTALMALRKLEIDHIQLLESKRTLKELTQWMHAESRFGGGCVAGITRNEGEEALSYSAFSAMREALVRYDVRLVIAVPGGMGVSLPAPLYSLKKDTFQVIDPRIR
ncbi:hypothetical protein [Streptomyces xanthochromogenes]|uniref:hypothetical protein n=1 Tax=Streptomyces xanthochromogenes TaxID=67384 RepID=UPI00342E724C